MDSVSFDELVPVLLCIVITGVVDAAGFKEDTPTYSVGLNGEAVRSNDTERLLSDVLVRIEVVHGQERLSLVFTKGIDLLGYVCL